MIRWFSTRRLPLNMVLFIQGEQMIAPLTDHSLFAGGTFPGRPFQNHSTHRINQQFSAFLCFSFNKISSTFLYAFSCSSVLLCSKSNHYFLQCIRICVFLLTRKIVNGWSGQWKGSAEAKIFHRMNSCSGSNCWGYRFPVSQVKLCSERSQADF